MDHKEWKGCYHMILQNTILCKIVKGNRCNMFMKVKGNHKLIDKLIRKVIN